MNNQPEEDLNLARLHRSIFLRTEELKLSPKEASALMGISERTYYRMKAWFSSKSTMNIINKPRKYQKNATASQDHNDLSYSRRL